ncbi:hypothetical protein KY284_011583 [Solanum tuberosum]|nr:hypothetical protein KY284_011583 [Solanum tuberosum]
MHPVFVSRTHPSPPTLPYKKPENDVWCIAKPTAGATCEFGGTAMLVMVNPSYDECHFVYI